MKVKRTERIWIEPNENIKKLCHLSKNLYNEANYIIRQEFFKNGKWIRYNELDKLLKNSENYKLLPTQTSQQILMLLDKSWKSFFKTLKEWKKEPEKFKARPKLPRYKKDNFLLIFTNQQAKIIDGKLKLPKKVGLEVRTRLNEVDLREVRIIPKGIGYVVEIVYDKEIDAKEIEKDRIAGIDFGTTNIVTIANNIGIKPIVVKDDGKGIKSINQFYFKEQAKLRSIYDLQKIKDGKKMRKLIDKHDRKVSDYTHKLSRFIVNWCVKHNIGKIVIGYNPNWKQAVNIGKQNNQIFTCIPYQKIIQQIIYKSEEVGIEVELQDEAHTSKCSFLDNEPIEHHDIYMGKRIKRGLFRSANGIIINADVNAAYNIIRKSEPKAFQKWNADGVGGCLGLHPSRLSEFDLLQSSKGLTC
ncbi:MAG: transposase [Thermoplasmata archaeon]